MEEDGNQNFACKFCNQGFASGRSLGGHMRWWHVHSIEFDEKRNITVKGFKAGERSGYGLRENPKKFSRVTASISNRRGHSEMQSDRLTVFVPKRKRSTRYLDLSRSNSEPSSSVAMYLLMLSAGKTFGYGLRENPKKSSGFMASNKRCYSDHLTAFVPKRKRSRTARYFDLCCSNSNASSSIDQELKIDQELEDEVAMALLMLSRGVPNLAGISSISDTDPIADYRVGNLGNPNSSDCGNVEFDGDEQKRVGLEDSVDGFSGIDSSVTEMAELSKGLRNGTGSEFETFEFNPRKKARVVDAFDPELKVIRCIKIKVPKVFDDLLKEGKYKCRACGKIFYSHQALGGHRSCCHNLEVDGSRHELKKSKVHQCPICFRVFASGRALGGHMGAHSVANSGVKVRQAIHPVIDLLLRKKSSMVMLASTNAG